MASDLVSHDSAVKPSEKPMRKAHLSLNFCISIRASMLGKPGRLHRPPCQAPSTWRIEAALFGTLPYVCVHLAVVCLWYVLFVELVNVFPELLRHPSNLGRPKGEVVGTSNHSLLGGKHRIIAWARQLGSGVGVEGSLENRNLTLGNLVLRPGRFPQS